jgi:PAS domain S-box-containing protein
MSRANIENRDWHESPSAPEPLVGHSDGVFESLLERSADAILVFEVYDLQTIALVNCNEAAVRLVGANNKEEVLRMRPEDFSPPLQLDGSSSAEKTAQIIALVQKQKTHRFEWMMRRLDGTDVPTEVSATAVLMGGKRFHIVISRDISERKKAERDLLELNQSLERRVAERTAALTTSEARFRALVEHAPEAIVVFEGDSGRFLFGNEHASRLYGVPMTKLAELTPAEVSPEFQPGGQRSDEMAREKMDEALAGGTPVFEWIHRRPDGTLVPTEVRLLRLPAEGRNLVRASIIDNTDRKRGEDALRDANHELYREIEQRRRAEELLNHRVRMSTLTAEVAVALNSDAECQPMLQRCCELVVRHLEVAFARVWTLNESTQTLELRASAGCYTHLDGPHSRMRVGELKIGLIAKEKKPLLINTVQSDRWVSDPAWAKREGMVAFAGYPLLIENRLLGVLGMFARSPLAEDVLETLGSIADSLALGVERKRSQIALAESEARFSAAFHASPILTMIFRSSDAKFVLINDAFLNWAGYSRDEVLGRTGSDLRLWEDPAERERYWKDVRRGGAIQGRECRVRNRHGRISTMLISGVTIELNGMDHLLVMGVDISERKQAEVELLRTLERETELNQLKSNFVSMVSHEFRTPLGIIQSSAELLREFYQKMPAVERDQQLDSITRNTRRMAALMEEMLVLSRLDAGKVDFKPAALDFGRFCRRIVDEVLSATNRSCVIELSLASPTLNAEADERLLNHIFTNLLSNAVKYSQSGSTVSFTVERDGADAVCTIRDHGIGISAQDQQHLFKAFHRGSNVGTRPGTGLGLLLVKRCVKLHHGTVQLVSQVGEGTTVTVRLPVFGSQP